MGGDFFMSQTEYGLPVDADDAARPEVWRWCAAQLGGVPLRWRPVAGDASLRRYYRLVGPLTGELAGLPGVIAMDSSADGEDLGRFVRLAQRFGAQGAPVPRVFVHDVQRGFALIEDFGDDSLLGQLRADTAAALYETALSALLHWQRQLSGDGLPDYDSALLRCELALFDQWLVRGYLALTPPCGAVGGLADVNARLIDSALDQPRVVVHRDYHSRNLMLLDAYGDDGGDGALHRRLGIIDFQDAVMGPVTYDPVSLLRDCYVAWPPAWVDRWRERYFRRLRAAGVLDAATPIERFHRWFDWMGMQRHLKAAGIFARLWLRDGRAGYLSALPRTLGYVAEVAGRYREFHAFERWLRRDILPALAARTPPR